MKTQFVKTPQGDEMAVLPRENYEKLIDVYEDGIDAIEAQHILERIQTGEVQTFPSELIFSIAEGKHPVKAFRNYRKMTAQTLAKLVSVSRPYISQIEAGERTGTLQLMTRIAHALNIDLELLIPETDKDNA